MLDMTVDDARAFLDGPVDPSASSGSSWRRLSSPRAQTTGVLRGSIPGPLDALHTVGLGYVRLGPPTRTLSGGERQRQILGEALRGVAHGPRAEQDAGQRGPVVPSLVVRYVGRMDAPARFARWLNDHQHKDRKTGRVYRYHSRSDAHSIALCEEILLDLITESPVLRRHASLGIVCYQINCRFTWPLSEKTKTLDLAIGIAKHPLPPAGGATIRRDEIADVLIACEAKTVMTEHGKSKPRVYDELSSSHEIVHQGRPDAIAAGITVINIAKTFVSPLRQQPSQAIYISEHKQPEAAAGMVAHLRGLPIRDEVGKVGFDAYASVVLECDNVTKVKLWSDPPAPQPADKDSYRTFVTRIVRFYGGRFSALPVQTH